MNRSRERMTAVRSRPLAATPRARPRHARGSRAGAQLGGAQLGGAPRLVEAAHLAAARGPREVTDPPGPGSLDGQRRARGAGTPEGQRGARGAGTPEGQRGARGAGRRRGAGPLRLASSGPWMTWAAGARGQWGPAAANRCPHPRAGAVRPGVRATVARSPGVPPRAARSACHEMRRSLRAAGTSPEHLGGPGPAWSPGQCRSRGIVPRRARRLACARRGECRSGHLANTRSSGSVPVPAPGPIPGTSPPGAGDRRGGGATRSG
jgi:hypothetical protein